MKICVWRTGHEIADRVAVAAYDGIEYTQHERGMSLTMDGQLAIPVVNEKNGHINHYLDNFDVHIGYGILRGMDHIFRECDRRGKPWFNIDKGYFKPGHYDGYYRVSLRGTQQVAGWPDPDWERWERLQLPIAEPLKRDGYTLVCPATDYAKEFFNDGTTGVPVTALAGYNYRVREKGDPDSIDWVKVNRVVTFNSSIGWQALQRGIPVVSNPFHSIVGAWQAKHGNDKREKLFATMAGLQLTLDEVRAGKLMPLIQKLLDVSAENKA